MFIEWASALVPPTLFLWCGVDIMSSTSRDPYILPFVFLSNSVSKM